MTRPIHILCISGTRADYGIYRPLLLKLAHHPKFHLSMVVTGMHLLQQYGSTIQEIRKDNLNIVATPNILTKGDSTMAMAQAVGLGVLYFSDIFLMQNPDYVLLLGDRGEMLAAAIAAHYQNKTVIHLHGGEKSGSADDQVRHAISLFSHIHFVSSHQSRQRLEALIGDGKHVYVTGSLRKSELKRIINTTELQRKEIIAPLLSTRNEQILLVLFHPDSKSDCPAQDQIHCLIQALQVFVDKEIIIIGTNSDAGGELFNQQLLEFTKQHPHAQFRTSLGHDQFLFVLQEASVLIGNSSSGIIEAPFFGTPVVNIGTRQKGREKAENIVDVPFNEEQIVEAIKKLLQSKREKSIYNPYDVVEHPEDYMIEVIEELIERSK